MSYMRLYFRTTAKCKYRSWSTWAASQSLLTARAFAAIKDLSKITPNGTRIRLAPLFAATALYRARKSVLSNRVTLDARPLRTDSNFSKISFLR